MVAAAAMPLLVCVPQARAYDYMAVGVGTMPCKYWLSTPQLEGEGNTWILGWWTGLDSRKPYLTEDQMLFGGEEAKGVDILEANTVYYTWAWQLVSEKADLEGASLCDAGVSGRENCIPIGAIRAG